MNPFTETGREINYLQSEISHIKHQLYGYVENYKVESLKHKIDILESKIQNIENDIYNLKNDLQLLKEKENGLFK